MTSNYVGFSAVISTFNLSTIAESIIIFSPSSSETEDIIKLIDAGMSCARFNMSHGTAKVSIFKDLIIFID